MILLALGNSAPPAIRMEPVANEGQLNAAGINGQPRGWSSSDRSDARSAIMRLQIARRSR